MSADDGRNTDLLPVYIGINRPDVLRFVVGNLTKGLPYRFSVQAINENGVSAYSEISIFYACRAPQKFDIPYYISSDIFEKTITIGWVMPQYDGGCPLYGYELFRNDGGTTSVDIKDLTMPNDTPSLTSYTVNMSAGTVGIVYSFKL